MQKQVKAKENEQAKVDKLRADIAKQQKERNTIEKKLNTTKTIDELNEQEAELNKQIENDKLILEDENTSSQMRAEVEARVAENEEELARLRTEIEKRETALPLREKNQKHFQKIWIHSCCCFPCCWHNNRCDCECTHKWTQICCQRSWKWFERSWKKDWSTSSWIDWFNRQFHLQNCRTSCWIPWKKCLAFDSCCCSFHG